MPNLVCVVVIISLRDFASRAQRGERDRGDARSPPVRKLRIGGKPTMRRCWNSKQTASRAASIAAWLVLSGGSLQQFPGLALQLKAGVLMGLGAGERRDALHEIEDALGPPMFFAQHGLDDLRRLRFGETALAQKALAVLVATGDDPLPRRLDPGDERGGRGIGETREH